jgi:hypothetical protein
LTYRRISNVGELISPSGADGATSSALLLGLDDVPGIACGVAPSEAAALGAHITVIANTSTKGCGSGYLLSGSIRHRAGVY